MKSRNAKIEIFVALFFASLMLSLAFINKGEQVQNIIVPLCICGYFTVTNLMKRNS